MVASPRRLGGSARRAVRIAATAVVVVLGLSLVGGSGPAGAAATDRVTFPADGVVKLAGHGYGHGRGLSQYGANGGARSGATSAQILDFYYPGTASVRSAPWGVKVQVTNDGDDVLVLADAGLAVHDLATGGGGVLPGGPVAWRIVRSAGKYGVHFQQPDGHWEAWTIGGSQLFDGPVQFSGPAIVRVVRPGDVRGYRGAVLGVASGTGLVTVNNLSLQDYLRGVVPREMPASWPAAALEAQTVAARSYTVAKMLRKPAGQYWDICDTTACQVYAGARTWVNGALTLKEEASTDAAINATDGIVRQSGGATILAEFSSSNGGWTVDGGVAYLQARQDPWDGVVASAAHSWSASLSKATLQSAFPSVGTLVSLEVTSRDGRGEWGGRVLTVVLRGVNSSGAATAVTVTGNQIRSAAGLRSNWFTFDVPLSAIETRYQGDSALRSALGNPVGTEEYGNGFAFQAYERGRLYWSAAAGVRLVKGGILEAYLAAGGAERLGVPTTDEGPAGSGGAFNHFANGASIYWSSATGAQLVRGAIRDRWLAMGAEWSLGFPTSAEVPVAEVTGAVRQSFTGGSVYWSAGTGAHELRGGLATAWSAAGGPGRLGLPSTGETAVAGGAYLQSYSRGFTLVWKDGAARLVGGGIREAWLARGGAMGALGLPTSDEADTPTGGGRYSTFSAGTIVWTASAGAVVLTGPIGDRWTALGGLNSDLGLPTGPQRATADGRGQYVAFASGAGIYWTTGAGTAYRVGGPLGQRWTAMGGANGLGLPAMEEAALGRGNGTYQVFAKGKIMWSAATGAHPVYGAIQTKYDSLGAEWSRLGLPTRGEYAVPSGTRADFQGGWIAWNSATGVTTVTYL
ncbi:SpoIID/LytB domain-containing protein [Geodermatophilus sp. SYSU D00691]